MKFSEALPQAIEKGVKLRAGLWPSDAYIYYDPNQMVFRHQSGINFDYKLNQCLEYDWFVYRRHTIFRLLTYGKKFRISRLPNDTILTKIPEHDDFNAITQDGKQTYKINDEGAVFPVD